MPFLGKYRDGDRKRWALLFRKRKLTGTAFTAAGDSGHRHIPDGEHPDLLRLLLSTPASLQRQNAGAECEFRPTTDESTSGMLDRIGRRVVQTTDKRSVCTIFRLDSTGHSPTISSLWQLVTGRSVDGTALPFSLRRCGPWIRRTCTTPAHTWVPGRSLDFEDSSATDLADGECNWILFGTSTYSEPS